jgi:hypothetical protein
MADFLTLGAYKGLLFDDNSNAFIEDLKAQMKVLVYHEASSTHLVDTTGSTKGKFHFTAAENGVHFICLYESFSYFRMVTSQGWFSSRGVWPLFLTY